MIRTILVLAVALTASPTVAAPEHHQLARPDGSPIHYTLDTPAEPSTGMVVLLTGSGCLPGAVNANIALARTAFASFTALIVEKAGITPDAAITNGFTDCPAAFHAQHTVSQRVADTARVLSQLPRERPLILFGGSEGGLAVAMLAASVEADAAIILSSGTGMAFDDLVLATVPPEGQATVAAGFAAARADPEGTAMFAGSSHRFWADILGLRAIDHMRQTTTPFLLIQGGRDSSSPVAAARIAADAFASEGRCNLTYWELPALDHGMTDPSGHSHMAAILAMAAAWASASQPSCDQV